MAKVRITWETTEVFHWAFDEEEIAPYREEDGELDLYEMESLLADKEGNDSGAYECTSERMVTELDDPGEPKQRPEEDAMDLAPVLPDIDPDAPDVSFVALECRLCRERSEWLRKDDRGEYHAWNFDHYQATGHDRFYVWTVARNTARTTRL